MIPLTPEQREALEKARNEQIPFFKQQVNDFNKADIKMIGMYEKFTGEVVLNRQAFVEGMRYAHALLDERLAELRYLIEVYNQAF